jgi:NAD+ kinase
VSVDGERAAGRVQDPRAGAARAREGAVRSISVLTHGRAEETAAALARLVEQARAAGVTLRFDAEEARKHGLSAAAGLHVVDQPAPRAGGDAAIEEQLCVVLGGDGTILRALRRYAGTDVPVFAVNFGEIGFLSTVDREHAQAGFRRAFAGDFDVLSLPGLAISGGSGPWMAINDVSMHRQPGKRVADLEYSVGADDIGRVRCDGLVVATPAGSTGYNLANGGPVMAWGVAGIVVSFIAPHSLTARALVVAPQDQLAIMNRSQEEPVDVTVDGRPVCTLDPNHQITVKFVDDQGHLAQLAEATFYHRLREKFGRLASMP